MRTLIAQPLTAAAFAPFGSVVAWPGGPGRAINQGSSRRADLEHALQLVALLRRLCAQGRGCLVASHDLNLFAPAADRVVVLHDGRVAADAPPAQALAPALLRSVFGVDCGPAGGDFPRAFRLPG